MNQNALFGKLGNCFLAWRRWLAREYSAQGVTLKQIFLLERLAKCDYLYPSDIADLLFADRPTVTVILRNMQRDGLVRKIRDGDDGKRFRISITAEGRRKVIGLAEESKRIAALFDPFSCFSTDERRSFAQLLGKLERHLADLPSER